MNRLSGETGYCGAGKDLLLGSWNAHPWEEPPISGTAGSGTIFFSRCTAQCLFCQNYPISQLGLGQTISIRRLAEIMLRLQQRGCHNINLVTPTHFVPPILAALAQAARKGLRLPLIYNTNGYDSPKTLELLDGVVDIYLPDAKYGHDEVAGRLSGFRHYVRANRQALTEMVEQVGTKLILDERGIAHRGLIVRHLILPDGLAGTDQVLPWIASHLGRDVHISLMNQYFPAHQAVDDPVLGRKITEEEHRTAWRILEECGLENGWVQEHENPEEEPEEAFS